MKRARNAFTLVEILIVVIVLGILAAIVIPQFTDASADAKASSLATNLQIVRGQIELYKLQHDGEYPDYSDFADQMTLYTKEDGSTSETKTGDFVLGPYLQSVPNNPYTDSNDLSDSEGATTAWFYDEDTGEFKANH